MATEQTRSEIHEQRLVKAQCVCGWEVVGTEDEVIPATEEHGRRVHNMVGTVDEVRARLIPVS